MTESTGGAGLRESFWQIHCDLPREAPGGEVYTAQAWSYLPPLHQPQILDIGCGPGEQTLTLARLTDGQITAIDTHQPYLDRLQAEANRRGWGDRIHCRQASMFDLSFVETPVDLIWSEGAIYIMGFTEGLQQWRSRLKPGGYLVVSELVWLRSSPPAPIRAYWQQNYPAMQTVETLLTYIADYGYRCLGHFSLPTAAWWNYYQPLRDRIALLRSHLSANPDDLAILDAEQQEIEYYQQYADWYGYAFFILQNVNPVP